MTIVIDDAGTGDLIGNAYIGFLKKETGEIKFKTIPLELFREDNWKNKIPFKITVDLVKEGLEELKFNKKNEKIIICRGNFFDQVRTYFNENGINYESTTIEGPLQDAVEGKLIQHLRDLGVKSKNLTKNSGAKRFFILFDWVCRDFYNREKYIKNGFKRWNSYWHDIAIEKYEKLTKLRTNS
jgi:hypothetical protein